MGNDTGWRFGYGLIEVGAVETVKAAFIESGWDTVWYRDGEWSLDGGKKEGGGGGVLNEFLWDSCGSSFIHAD